MSTRPMASAHASIERGGPSIGFEVALPADVVEVIARRAAELVAAGSSSSASPWLSTEQAAEYLAAKPARVHDLVALGRLTPRRDGRRLLFRRVDLDEYLEASVR